MNPRFTLDEGYAEGDLAPIIPDDWLINCSIEHREELAYKLLQSLPLSRLAKIQRWIAPRVQIDIVGLLPTEISLLILKNLSYESVLICTLVSRRWNTLANDQVIWRALCDGERWVWKEPTRFRSVTFSSAEHEEQDDEGVAAEEEEDHDATLDHSTICVDNLDSGFLSLSINENPPLDYVSYRSSSRTRSQRGRLRSRSRARHSAPSILPSPEFNKPDYKLLYQTHTLLRNRISHGSFRLTALQNRGTPGSHTATIYCLQLYTFSDPEKRQVLFTGSKDKTIRQWDLPTGMPERIFEGVHIGSVLSLCAHGQYLISGGSDHLIVVWDILTGVPLKIIRDHSDSVLCVRFDGSRLVSCSKDRTVRTYLLPSFRPDLVFSHHRAAVNAVALSPTLIVSASGDRSIRLWDASSGQLLRTFESHHSRGIASIDYVGNCILSGSSDKHLRLHDLTTDSGWSTCPNTSGIVQTNHAPVCETCGARTRNEVGLEDNQHTDLVRSVSLGTDFVVSASYDHTVKVWDRRKGLLVADLTGGHSGRVFSVDFDCTKIVSCGEDQRICIWDFGHGIDTSFIEMQD